MEKWKIWVFVLIFLLTLLLVCFKRSWPKERILFTGAVSTTILGIIPAKILAASFINCIVLNFLCFFILEIVFRKSSLFLQLIQKKWIRRTNYLFMITLSLAGAYFLGVGLTASLIFVCAFLLLFRYVSWEEALANVKWNLVIILISCLIFQKGMTQLFLVSLLQPVG